LISEYLLLKLYIIDAPIIKAIKIDRRIHHRLLKHQQAQEETGTTTQPARTPQAASRQKLTQ
jgi:hypothetical protein